MIVRVMKLTDKKTGEIIRVTEKTFNAHTRKMKKNGLLQEFYEKFTFTNEQKIVKSFKFEAWVHPHQGGDDYPVEWDICADSQEEAEKVLKKELAKKSGVLNDYKLISGGK